MVIKQATGLIAWYMRLFSFKGWASFWDTIYLAPGFENNAGLILHEAKHLEQIKRDGYLKFTIQYLWWNCTRRYENNPYENEAREAQNSILIKG